MLTTADIRAYVELYSNSPDDLRSPRFSPLLADHFEGLPPALLLPVEYDPIRDDSFAYHEKLREAGVPSHLYLGKGLVHGCMRGVEMSPGVRAMYQEIVRFITHVTQGPEC